MTRRVLGLAAAALTATGALLAGGALLPREAPPAPPPAEAVTAVLPVVPAGRDLPRSRPVRLDVGRIGVHVDLMMLGLNPDGTVQVPEEPEDAGWYAPGYAPGEPGGAVILGHVDGEGRRGVFHDLGRMRRGDTIGVTRADGRTARFTVTSVERVAKSRFPAERVYGPLDHPALRLVTCGGSFDAATGHYRDNVIVYADLA
ncbi:class F sortase [Herbidospora sp. NBRC 101105]|uniref:class F sortase n=1 Tax=Herbidospora sp. NBRC 101105 TaxID=3032195 RepID=UPI0024A45B61|nr:class F sortase [Herbidospora sp. NBRC 101105]GLX96715.1 class F sortase [Herbidospora sp. NBRC 101105]